MNCKGRATTHTADYQNFIYYKYRSYCAISDNSDRYWLNKRFFKMNQPVLLRVEMTIDKKD